MKASVTLKELVGTKIIYAALLVCYYWMWAREDWHDYYHSIQNVVFTFTIIFLVMRGGRIYKYGKEEKDAQAMQHLRRIDAIGLKIMAAAAIAIAFACAAAFIDGKKAGYALVGAILVLAVVRFVLFCAVSRKEIG